MDLENQIHINESEKKCNVQAIPYSVSPALPELFNDHIEHALHMAAHILQEGEELPYPMFFLLSKDNNNHFLDADGAPMMETISWISAMAREHDAVSVITLSEGWTVPEDIAKQIYDSGVPEGGIKSHPKAFPILRMQIETLNGIWAGVMPVSDYIEHEEDEQAAPRTFTGSMELNKIALEDSQVTVYLWQNQLAAMPEELRRPLERLMELSKGQDSEEEGKPE